MTVFSAREGLATTTIPRIVVDSKGFVWLPGSEGLARFDGNGFRIFTQADGLPAGVPSDIFERRDGTYWVAVQEHLCLFDPLPNRKRFQCQSPRLGVIQTLLEDADPSTSVSAGFNRSDTAGSAGCNVTFSGHLVTL